MARGARQKESCPLSTRVDEDLGAPGASTSGTESSGTSVDSAEQRARAAAAKVQDYGDMQATSKRGNLPGVHNVFKEGLWYDAFATKHASCVVAAVAGIEELQALAQVSGKPKFLDPEATRKRKVCAAHLRGPSTHEDEAAGAALQTRPVDISRLAPRLKGALAGGVGESVLSAPAKRAKGDGPVDKTGAFSKAALVAMMGGSLGPESADQVGAVGADTAEPKVRLRSKPTAAMGVTDFLAKPGSQLPRQKQERKDKEKAKRGKGQSSHNVWKSEAEMVLRQQYD